jgi:hypothetical protein
MSTPPSEARPDIFNGIVVKIINANDLQRLVPDADDEVSPLHIGDGGDIAHHIFTRRTTPGVLEVPERFPFAGLVLLGVRGS